MIGNAIAPRPLWFVWDRQSGAPTREHESERSALEEAKRLATLNPGRRFHVLVAVAVAERMEPVTVTRLAEPDDLIPF